MTEVTGNSAIVSPRLGQRLGIILMLCLFPVLTLGASLQTENGCEDLAPTVLHGLSESPEAAEEEVLFDRLLSLSANDAKELRREIVLRNQLVEKAKDVLRDIRSKWPQLAHVRARPDWRHRTVILDVDESLMDILESALPEEGLAIPFCTGIDTLDSLHAEIDLRSVQPYPEFLLAVIEFGLEVPMEWVLKSYLQVEGVISARPDFKLGDGSDLAILNIGHDWVVSFRKAWGDCPAGCIHEEEYFFIVRAGVVEQIDQQHARNMSEFEILRWHVRQ